jgi:hypothetical protein
LADDQSPNKEAIRKLVEVIMKSVWKGAGNDTLAHQELEQEEIARQAHFDLLESALVADLLDPDSLITQEDLLATLLCAEEVDFEAALTLFDPPQLKSLLAEADNRPVQDDGGALYKQVSRRIEMIKSMAQSC